MPVQLPHFLPLCQICLNPLQQQPPPPQPHPTAAPGWGPDDTQWVCASSCHGVSLPLSPPTKRWAHTGRRQATTHGGKSRLSNPPLGPPAHWQDSLGPKWPAPPTTLHCLSAGNVGPWETREDGSPLGPLPQGSWGFLQPSPLLHAQKPPPHPTASCATTKRQRQSHFNVLDKQTRTGRGLCGHVSTKT